MCLLLFQVVTFRPEDVYDLETPRTYRVIPDSLCDTEILFSGTEKTHESENVQIVAQFGTDIRPTQVEVHDDDQVRNINFKVIIYHSWL